ncbi:MAG: hypothetical protein HKO65_01845, partial [Gemmatimonadetes bacterium]|nr:hypothetical protein [Gemmatimonadota bacterium]
MATRPLKSSRPLRSIRSRHLILAVTLLATSGLPGCATLQPRPSTDTPDPATEAAELPGAIRWVRRSAEYRALAYQAYTAAAEHLRDTVPTLTAGPWGVIMDADETVLDNSEYQRRRAAMDSTYSVESWAAWVNQAEASAVPGALAFTREVRRLGGHVVIVTNRDDMRCEPTRANLNRLGVAPDLVLCQ